MIKYGIGTAIENYHIVEKLGMAYIELPGNKIAAMTDEAFATVVDTVKQGSVACCGFNAALPPEITLCGAGFDLESAQKYVTLLCQRGHALGISTIGVGSPKSRKVQPEDDQAAAWNQVAQFLAMFADVAKPYGITVLYESLNRTESQFGLKIREGADLVKAVGRDNLRLVFDIYHFAIEEESLEDLTYALPYVKHIHIAERVGAERRYPSVAKREFYQSVLELVVASGYDGALCTEAFDGDIYQGGLDTIALLDGLLADNKYFIGCVADDFTGASDAASFLMSQGLKTILCNGIPAHDVTACDAIVIALKSRTQPVDDAVADCKAAFAWLQSQGAKHLYFKYCSTFDSTPQGNIGPVTDMMLETLGQQSIILAPALPANGRVVKDGALYTWGTLLHESPMKDHPLTPMWASKLGELMAPQGKYDTLELHGDVLAKSKEEILAVVAEFGATRDHFYVVPDYETDEQGEKIVAVFGDQYLHTGGSGILAPMAKQFSSDSQVFAKTSSAGKALLLSGSCSKATLEQVAEYAAGGNPTFQMDPLALVNGSQTVDEIWAFIAAHQSETVLVYSSDSPENVVSIQKIGKEKVAETLEQTTAELAKIAVDAGYTRIIVAGGETSSAVVKRLGYEAFEIGVSIAPGVPIMVPLAQPNLQVALKSGNFGQTDFFQRALDMTGE